MKKSLILSLSVAPLSLFMMAACSQPAEDETTEDYIKPEAARSTWEVAARCDFNQQLHAAVAERETKEHAVIWRCGDVDGVDGINDRGQEYCEYYLVNNGKMINKVSELDRKKPLYCMVTSVYKDASKGLETKLASDVKAMDFDKDGKADGVVVDPALIRMKGQFNNRFAATALIDDAENYAAATKVSGTKSTKVKHYQRLAACYEAGKTAGKLEEAKALCADKQLANTTVFNAVVKELAAKGITVKVATKASSSFDFQQNMVACLSMDNGLGGTVVGGETFRTSDPHISQVAVRSSTECGCAYDALPNALEGFLQGSWSSASTLPAGCQRVKSGGVESQQLTFCSIPSTVIDELEFDDKYSNNLQRYCNETFARNIVMTAPVSAVEVKGTCKDTGTNFCKAWSATSPK